MGTIGIILYIVSMWVSGINQGLMLRATNPDGSLLYPSFVETLIAIRPMYIVRFLGGSLYLIGICMMGWNLVKTALNGKAVNGTVEVAVEEAKPEPGVGAVLSGRPLWFSLVLFAVSAAFVMSQTALAIGSIVVIAVISEVWWVVSKRDKQSGRPSWFALIERRPLAFTVLTLIAVLIGGVAELVPTLLVKEAVPATGEAQKPYAALELEGRDIYVREGCYVCHSQMVRPMMPETLRFGEPSRAEEYIYDHPFQWGSKRTGPDLHRVGGRYPSLWHYTHLMDPRQTSPGSNMPVYTWLLDHRIDFKETSRKLALFQKLGVPYTNKDIDEASIAADGQASVITHELEAGGVKVDKNSDMVALIAYLQRLGRDHGVALAAPTPVAPPTPAPAAEPAPAPPAEPAAAPAAAPAGGP